MRGVIFAAVLGLAGVCFAAYGYLFSSYQTKVGRVIPQTVPFSHAHHVGGLGLDCRYCHANAADSSFVGMPTTETCMNCHWQLWTNADLLEPVRESWRTGMPLHWRRVYKLPEYVYVNHSVHINGGVGCETCHGRVDKMPLMWKANTLYMKWCLNCHRDPTPYLRPQEQIYTMGWQDPNQAATGAALLAKHDINTNRLTNCSACHR